MSDTDTAATESPRWLHGHVGLHKDGEGYVYWRGSRVEHYSFREDVEGERAAAAHLASICLSYEQYGIEVRWGTVLQDKLLLGLATSTDPKGPLWAEQLSRRQLYTTLQRPSDERTALLFWHAKTHEGTREACVCALVSGLDPADPNGARELSVMQAPPIAEFGIAVFYKLQRDGFESPAINDDAQLWLQTMSAAGIEPHDAGDWLDRALAGENNNEQSEHNSGSERAQG
jgi:hypothetical protein